MINAIYASKLYRASKRKEQIEAAFNSAASAELVTQLQSYLDSPYQKLAEEKEEPAPAPTEETSAPESEGSGAESSTPSDKGGSAPSHHSAGGSGGFSMPSSLEPDDFGEDFVPEDNLYEIPEDDEAPADDTSAPEEPVEEATVIEGSTNVINSVDVIKGTLNGDEKTAGVTRIQTKENEFWVYYNDDTNLNNIMTDVIEYFNAAGYTDLEFNRLARSDNAIVFVINSVTEDIKPIEAVEGTKE